MATAMVQTSEEFTHMYNCQQIMTIKEINKFSNVLKYCSNMQIALLSYLCGTLLISTKQYHEIILI